METKLTIKCDIKDAQAILYSASKIIRDGEAARDQERINKRHEDSEAKVTKALLESYEEYVASQTGYRNLPASAKARPEPRSVDYGDVELDVYKFMALDDEDKVKYINVADDNEYDIAVFDRRKNYMYCDVCGQGVNLERHYLIGTSDTREPKFCYVHYIQINTDSKFVKDGGINA